MFNDYSFWMQIILTLKEYWSEALASLGSLLAGWLFGYWRARQQWRQREFLTRLNISLNTLHEGKLFIRTLAEMSLEAVFPNPAAVTRLRQAIQKTTADNPIPPLSEEDFWPVLNCVLNVISEKFSDGYIRKDLGYPVKTAKYLICLTRERAAEMRTSKIRAMVIQKATLLNLPEHEPEYEQPSHSVRFRTLKQLAALYQQNSRQFLEVEFSQ